MFFWGFIVQLNNRLELLVDFFDFENLIIIRLRLIIFGFDHFRLSILSEDDFIGSLVKFHHLQDVFVDDEIIGSLVTNGTNPFPSRLLTAYAWHYEAPQLEGLDVGAA